MQALVTSSNPGSAAHLLDKRIGLSLGFLMDKVRMVTLRWERDEACEVLNVTPSTQ